MSEEMKSLDATTHEERADSSIIVFVSISSNTSNHPILIIMILLLLSKQTAKFLSHSRRAWKASRWGYHSSETTENQDQPKMRSIMHGPPLRLWSCHPRITRSCGPPVQRSLRLGLGKDSYPLHLLGHSSSLARIRSLVAFRWRRFDGKVVASGHEIVPWLHERRKKGTSFAQGEESGSDVWLTYKKQPWH